MIIKDKKIIVFGLGISGKSSVKALSSMGAQVLLYDDREYEQLKYDVFEISDYEFEVIQEDVDIDWTEIYCILKSPGIRLDNEFIKIAESHGVEVITDIELAYRIYGGDNFVGLTGTNGKTTTTSLIAHILNESGVKSKLVGNIGVGLLWEMYTNGLEYTYVLELSSFQLASIKDFRSKITIITNISEDHTDWHGSFENYKDAKLGIVDNLIESDLLILNRDDKCLNKLDSTARIEYFSLIDKTDAYFEDGYIYVNNLKIDRKVLKLVGKHNVANALAAILACRELGLNKEDIEKAVASFNSIDHRIEYVTSIDGVAYYNDSKGTNIYSTKVALEGFDDNIILIAGGYDKKIEFDELFTEAEKIKALILLGQTKEKIADTAIKYGINEIYIVDDMDQALKKANEIAVKGDTVLLSPASASWGLYNNYKERGNHFKKIVKNYEKK